VPYTATIGVAGGTAPYSCIITAGILPAGLSISGCVVSGTPTVAGTANLTVKATDSSSSIETTTGPVSLTVLPATITLVLTSPPNATVGTPYSGTIGVSGGTSPYSCVITSGTLPAGLTQSGCVVSGTPTTAGTANLTVKATDSSNPVATTTGPVTLTVSPASVSLTVTSPPNATVETPYSGTIGVSGGTSPYSCLITAGTLPAGLTATGCLITGTPTTAGTANLTVKATDSGSPVATTTGPVTLTVSPIPPLSLTGSLPNAILGQSYTQTLTATGGISPYTYHVTAGNLPAGLALSTAGVISGVPTAPGASSFTVTVTDTETTPQTASLPLVLLVVYPTIPNDSELTGPYAFLFQGYDDVLVGVLAYQTATVGSFTADGTGVVSNGELDSNHQSSNPSGTTISSNAFLGTYTIGTDNRGMLTITNLNPDGTTAGTSTYAISVKAPVAPATISTQADLIEFDNNSLQGTRGSGTMLAQQSASFSAGLNGSYAFGLSGDTPCLPSCTLGITAGPVAAVGRFTTNGSGLLTSGTSDANIATTNFASETLAGSYGSADGNGRLPLTITISGAPTGVFPTDYAVYIVSANEAFVLSTDKHSSYILLAGSAQLQTQPTFDNSSMSGPFIGYENAQSNPGLLGSTLQSTINFSTSTIFRATASGGTCDITNVDVAGTTALVNQITGLGGLLPTNIVQDLLGTYQTTGSAACPVANTNGRGVLNYPVPTGLIASVLGLLGLDNPPAPRVFYLISPDRGYFLETGYAGLGNFEPQTGAPFSNATLNGTFVYGTAPASTLAGVNGSGTITANGAGSATSTLDLNVGVGTVNLLELGVSSTSTYVLTDATAGRYSYGTSILYAISPTRFVLLDTGILSTSPSVALLY
jgi:Putative Ig domain